MKTSTIQIVENEAIVAMDLQSRLQSLGFDVSAIAMNGEEAIEFVTRQHPDLIIMDIGLGETMDGIETAQRIQEQINIPIVFLTAYNDARTIQRAQALLPAAYLVKPFANEDLLEAINMALGLRE